MYACCAVTLLLVEMEEKEAKEELEESKETLQNEQQKFQELSTEYVMHYSISV